jgi:peptide deformylase
MIREVVKYGNPVLRAKGTQVKTITEEIRKLAADMIETMEHANGVGLAAQQVGVPIQLSVIDVTKAEDRPSTMTIEGKPCDLSQYMPLVFVNPRLEAGKEREIGIEGCLSFPEVTADIERPAAVKATVTLLDGRELQFEATGLLSRALQHETDHLHGILFIDRMNSATKASLAGRLKRMKKETAQSLR